MPNSHPSRSVYLCRCLLLLGLVLPLSGCSGFDMLNAVVPSGEYGQPRSFAYGDHPRQKLDLYLPADADKPLPLVVFFYGGRWERGEREDYSFVADVLTRQGYATAIVDYRLYPEVRFPAFVEDGADAVVWLQRHGRRFGGWPGGVFLMGHSAGAHIAALLALDPGYLARAGGDRSTLAGMIGLAGPYAFLPLEATDLKAIFGPPAHYARSQPINYVSALAPPLLLLHGEDDETVIPRNSRNLAAHLEAVSAPVTARFYAGEDHVSLLLSLVWPFRDSEGPLAAINGFIERWSGTGSRLTAVESHASRLFR
jgi:acetyl esterase/lipase